MSNLSVTEALKLVDISKTTLYADISKGVLSCDVDAKGRKRIDPAELQRVYGKLKSEQNGTPNLNGTEQNQTHAIVPQNDPEIVLLLKSHIERLETEVSVAREREQNLMEMLAIEQQKTLRMLPAPKGTKKRWSLRNIFRLT
ncbi:MAG: hypothetical protein F4118_12370 [Acidimicrobiaceae bacterium]|nr:hypothetical protein [Candidatus Poribacteria bacterium]MYI37198.1 hypothetical protein [Acidimicrobiaceae bacterium]